MKGTVGKVENKFYEIRECKFTRASEIFRCFSMLGYKVVLIISAIDKPIDIVKFSLISALGSPRFLLYDRAIIT